MIFVSLIWGLGFPALKVVSDIPSFGIISIRFCVATLLLLIVFIGRLRNLDKKLIRNGFILSIFLFLTYVFCTLGIKYTSSAKASFFSCLGVLIIPLLSRLLFKTKITRRIGICIAVSTTGLLLISYSKGMGMVLAPGDIICIGASVCGALHVIFVGKLAQDQDPALLTIVQLFFISGWASAASFLFEDFPVGISNFQIFILLFLGIFCTAAAFLIQTWSQQRLSASRTGIILAIEPVSGAIFSAVLLGDHIGINWLVGGSLIFASLVYSTSRY